MLKKTFGFCAAITLTALTCVVVAQRPAAEANKAPASPAAESFAPIMNDESFLVIKIDVAKIDTEKVWEYVTEQIKKNAVIAGSDNSGLENMLEGMKQFKNMFFTPLAQILDKLKKDARIESVYIISRTDFLMNQIPFIVAIPVDNTSEEQQAAMKQAFGRAKFNISPSGDDVFGFPVRFVRHGFFITIPGPLQGAEKQQDYSYSGRSNFSQNLLDQITTATKALFTNLKTSPRGEIAEAFDQLKDYPINTVLVRPTMFTQSVIHLRPMWSTAPFLQDDEAENDESDTASDDVANPFGGSGSGKGADPFAKGNNSLADKIQYELTEGISWIAVGSNPMKNDAKVIVRSTGPNGAKQTLDTFLTLINKVIDYTYEEAEYSRYNNPITTTFETPAELKKFIMLFMPQIDSQQNQLVFVYDEQFEKKNGKAIQEVMQKTTSGATSSAKRMQDSNNLRQLALAMHNYHDAYNSFPSVVNVNAKGKPSLTWRVTLLPFLEQKALYDSIIMVQQENPDAKWDDDVYKPFHTKMPGAYKSPFLSDEDAKKGLTNYVAVTGKETVFIGPGKWIGMSAITDGTSNTIMFSERSKPMNWMDPACDVPFEVACKGINVDENDGLGSPAGTKLNGINVAICDGSVKFISDTVNPDILKALFTKSGGESMSYDSFDGLDQPRPRKRQPRYDRPTGAKEIPARQKNTSCSNNLKQIMLAMHNFHDAQNCLPYWMLDQSDKPVLSWRVQLLPYFEETALYDEIIQVYMNNPSAKWDDDVYKPFHTRMPDTYWCPETSPEDAKNGLTVYSAVVGEKGSLRPGKRDTFARLADGTSNTIAVVELATPVNWMDPEGDVKYEIAAKGIGVDKDGVSAVHKIGNKKGVNVAMFDGSVRFVPADVRAKDWANSLCPNDGNPVSLP
ncbi:MAG: DUF1559 domain-containing protein [Thermoguttaceae bacterium]